MITVVCGRSRAARNERLLFYHLGETQPRPLAPHCNACGSPQPEGSPSQQGSTLLLWTPRVGPWWVQDSHFLLPKLCEKAKSGTIRQSSRHNASHTRRVRYSPPADSLCVTLGRRIEGSPISSAHPPTSLLYLNFLLLGIFSSVAFLILDSFPDLFYFAIGSPDVVIYKGKNQQSESFPSFTQSAPSHCCLQNFVLPGGPASFSGETEDHSWDHTFSPTSYANAAS